MFIATCYDENENVMAQFHLDWWFIDDGSFNCDINSETEFDFDCELISYMTITSDIEGVNEVKLDHNNQAVWE
jgi:hypothetical protein